LNKICLSLAMAASAHQAEAELCASRQQGSKVQLSISLIAAELSRYFGS